MRLCIADPPYLGTAEMLYGTRDLARLTFGGSIGQAFKADRHPDAHLWDDPETHREMVEMLCRDYDGWAIAMVPDSLRHYLQWVPSDVIVAVWHNPRVMPTGRHPRRRWEPVLVKRAEGRKRVLDVSMPVGDVLTCVHSSGSFAGQKPPTVRVLHVEAVNTADGPDAQLMLRRALEKRTGRTALDGLDFGVNTTTGEVLTP